MFGGNDGNNTLIPIDTAGYGQYAAARPPSSAINLRTGIAAADPAGQSWHALRLASRVAGAANAVRSEEDGHPGQRGNAVATDHKAQYNAGVRPLSLYSHADQQAQWQSSISNNAAGTGWGGRLADKVASFNAASGFPVVTSLDGTVLFTTGTATVPLTIPVTGSFALSGYGGSTAANARLAAVKQLLTQGSANTFVTGANAIGSQALQLSATVNPILASTNSTVAPIFANQKTGTANQLYQVAKMIEARAATGAKRQIFFVQLVASIRTEIRSIGSRICSKSYSPALKAFYDATVALGVSAQVTTFTLSDFGRTFQPASGGGTDHAWGSHHFIIGDSVKGGLMYGLYPQLVLAGPSDAETEGRWVPSTAVDQYGATLARWFGVGSADLGTVFPNLAKFPTSDLGFMS